MSKALYPAGIAEVISAASTTTALVYKMLLVDSTYTFDADETVMTTAVASEISGTGYTAGGVTTTFTGTHVAADDECLLDNENESWVGYNAGQTKAAIIYIEKGAASADIPLCYIDDGFPLDASGATIEVNTPNGIVGIPSAIT